jgi:hypothetical protein
MKFPRSLARPIGSHSKSCRAIFRNHGKFIIEVVILAPHQRLSGCPDQRSENTILVIEAGIDGMSTDKIRELNDKARKTFSNCRVMITRGVQALNNLDDILNAVREFDTFNADNDPYSEHDFGKIKIGDETIFWKFDYYDLKYIYASPDAADESVTVRVLTIMLASEY